MKRIIKTWLSTIMVVIFFATQGVASATDNFVKVSLPKGVSLELPKNWVVLSGNQRITLDSAVESGLDLSGIGQEASELPFAANYYDKGNAVGVLNVRYYPQLELTQTDAQSANSLDVKELNAALKENMIHSMKASGITVSSWLGTKKYTINGITTFITEYNRKSFNGSGDFRVRLVRVFAVDKSFTLTVSYHEAESFVLEPITDRIINSLKAKGIEGASRTEVSMPTSSSALDDIYGEQWELVLLLSFLLTWGIGLTPPLLIRFVFMRRAIGTGWAIGIVVLFWMLSLPLSAVLGSHTHNGALALVAVASYVILSREK